MHHLISGSRFRAFMITIGMSCMTVMLGGCFSASSTASRAWVDDGTAVAVMAQGGNVTLSREDFPAGVNVRDYAELGAFEVNRSGMRTLYLSLTVWSTIDRTAMQWQSIEDSLAEVTLWANDQPLRLKRTALQSREVGLSKAAFGRPSPTARQMYFAVTRAQLEALAHAAQWRLLPVKLAAGEQGYSPWSGGTDGMQQFLKDLVPAAVAPSLQADSLSGKQ